MIEDYEVGGWHLDKRVSVGHLVTTLSVAAAVAIFFATMDKRIEENRIHIGTNKENIHRIENTLAGQNTEILRQLERIDGKFDLHLQQHVDRNGDR